MGIDFNNLKSKAQQAAETARSKAGEHTDKLDKAADAAKSRFGQHSDKIDGAVGKAKQFLNRDGQSGGGTGSTGGSSS